MIDIGRVRSFAKQINAQNAQKFTQHVVPHVVRPARIIWNQAIGAVFLLFAVSALFKAAQFYRQMAHDSQSGGRFVVALVFGLIMASFGIASFLRARRIAHR